MNLYSFSPPSSATTTRMREQHIYKRRHVLKVFDVARAEKIPSADSRCGAGEALRDDNTREKCFRVVRSFMMIASLIKHAARAGRDVLERRLRVE